MRNAGFALPLSLILATLIGMLALAASRTALTEARLGSAVVDARRAFSLAEHTLKEALEHAARSPESLPEEQDTYRLSLTATTHQGTAEAVIRATHRDTICPEYISGIRRHYEIIATASSGSVGNRIHRQGFYICRETCPTELCTLAESAPVTTYWTIGE